MNFASRRWVILFIVIFFQASVIAQLPLAERTDSEPKTVSGQNYYQVPYEASALSASPVPPRIASMAGHARENLRLVVSAHIPELQKQADAGDIEAQYRLGIAYQNGYGVIQSDVQAVAWYRKAAEHGFAPAQNNLGYAYHHGTGLAKDYEEAARWYRKAAEQGEPAAEGNLGIMYEWGCGVSEDYQEAVTWYRKAAEQGEPSAQNSLGSMGSRQVVPQIGRTGASGGRDQFGQHVVSRERCTSELC
jgi:hypothetical protein